jgi:hypothetical protein
MENLECSACGNFDGTVDRNMFDGMCADCTEKSLYDDLLLIRAKKRNEELINETSSGDSL